LDEAVILRSNADNKRRFDSHRPVNGGDGIPPPDCNDFRHRHQEKIRQRDKEHDRRSADP
jgi:hypothetical protein